jgi:hypothetical protein
MDGLLMAEQLLTGSISAPGFFGLNVQDSSVQLSSGFALEANNCVIDKYGRIGARQGWTPVNTTRLASQGNFRAIYEVFKDDGNVVLSAADNKLYEGTTTLTQLAVRNSTDTGNLTYTITDDNWQISGMPYDTGATPSGHAILAQAGHPTLVYHKLGSTAHAHTGAYGLQRLGDIASNLPGSYTVTDFTPNVVMTAYGRVWVADIANDRQTVYFSDLLDPTEWKTGTSGYLNISEVVPNNDPIVALADHNGFLIIFCEKHIVIYRNPVDPSSLTLEDTITGIGCIARDSVASIGTDLMFLSSTGVQSLQRVVQEKSLPFRDISKNVRDELLANVNSEVLKYIKAVYYPTDAFYLLSLPSTGFTYCFDTRGALENGAARTTIWKQIRPTAFCVTQDRQLYIGKDGYIGKYNGYEDNGATYRMSYFTNYFNFDSDAQLKILKKINVTAIGGSAQPIAVKWGYDYTRNYFSRGITLDRVQVFEYGASEYNVATYTNGIALDIARIPASGSGTVLQLGFESDIDGTPLSIQKIDFALKQGKTLL